MVPPWCKSGTNCSALSLIAPTQVCLTSKLSKVWVFTCPAKYEEVRRKKKKRNLGVWCLGFLLDILFGFFYFFIFCFSKVKDHSPMLSGTVLVWKACMERDTETLD